jgi:hypothetical protein
VEDPVKTFYYYTVLPSFNKLIVKKDFNLSMEVLPATMSEKRLFGTFSTYTLVSEMRKFIR